MSRAEMDVSMYSPEGRIIQIEYAMKAMNLGTTTVAGCIDDKIIIVSEKKLINKLAIPSSVRKNEVLFEHIGMSFSGIRGDAKKILQVGREICLNHFSLYHENISMIGLLKNLANLSLQFSEEMNKKLLSRPFGASILLGAIEESPQLYTFDPSGSYHKHKIVSIGAGNETVKASLEEAYKQNMSFDDLLKLLLENVASVMQEKITEKNIEIMIIEKEQVKKLSEEEILKAIKEIL